MALSAEALEAAYRRLEQPVYNYLFRWFWDASVCEDLIHDAFERLWKKRERIDPERIDALVWTSVINLARNHHARSKRWRWLPLPASLTGRNNPETETELNLRDRRLRQALDQLPRQSREVLLLELYADMSRVEIARTLGVAEGTLASRKHTAIARLRRLLEESES